MRWTRHNLNPMLNRERLSGIDWQDPQTRRWLALFIGVGALLVLALYAVTDTSYLAHDHALNGADWLGAAVCHRLTARSFTVAGRQLPLCARCTGIYLGVFLSFAVLLLAGRSRWGELPRTPILLTLLAFIGIMGVDGVNSYTHFFPDFPHVYEPRNWLRLVTGMGAGLAMGLILFPALAQTVWAGRQARPAIRNFKELAGMVLVGATAVILVLSNQPAIMYVLALASAAGTVLVLMAVNAVLLLTIFRREGRAMTWRDTAVPLTLCIGLAIVQLSAISLLRLSAFGTITGFPGL